MKFSLFNVEAYPNSDIGAGTEIGTFEFLVDGVGVGAKVGGYSGIFQAGPLDVRKIYSLNNSVKIKKLELLNYKMLNFNKRSTSYFALDKNEN